MVYMATPAEADQRFACWVLGLAAESVQNNDRPWALNRLQMACRAIGADKARELANELGLSLPWDELEKS